MIGLRYLLFSITGAQFDPEFTIIGAILAIEVTVVVKLIKWAKSRNKMLIPNPSPQAGDLACCQSTRQ